jgi:hypothetical protein
MVKPYVNDTGTLVIPFSSDPRFHHWKERGMHLVDILVELNAGEQVLDRYFAKWREHLKSNKEEQNEQQDESKR